MPNMSCWISSCPRLLVGVVAFWLCQWKVFSSIQ
jgi:hypothetical protein